MAAVGADNQDAVAFDDAAPGVSLVILHPLSRRSGRRSRCGFFHGRRVGRDGFGCLAASKTDGGGHAECS